MKFKKLLCSILAVLMLCSMLSAFAYADETDDAVVDTSEEETDDATTEGESEEGEEGEDGEVPKNEEIIITEEGMTGDGTTGDPAHLATYTLASENKNLAFYVNDITGFFALVNKKTNDIWFSNPVDWEKDQVAQASNKKQLQSQLVVTYLNASYDILTIPSTEAHIVSEHKDNKQIFTYVFSGATRNFSIPVCFELMDDYLDVHVIVEDIVNDTGNIFKNISVGHVALVKRRGIGYVEIIPTGAVVFRVYAVKSVGYLGKDVCPYGVLGPGGIYLA